MNQRNYTSISVHETSDSQLKINWDKEYNNEYYCPFCITGKLEYYHIDKSTKCKIKLECKSCRKKINLTCPVPAYIYIITRLTLNALILFVQDQIILMNGCIYLLLKINDINVIFVRPISILMHQKLIVG